MTLEIPVVAVEVTPLVSGEVPSSPSPKQLPLVRRQPYPGPVVRWAGGKTRLLDRILRRVPPRWSRYLEPFMGGAALFLRLPIGGGGALISDTCEGLVELYQELARDAVAVSRELGVLSDGFPTNYQEVRSSWNLHRDSWSGPCRAATFLYLNKSCFNGLWRVNRMGHFNVPIGSFDDGPAYPSLSDLVAAGQKFRAAEIACLGYEEAMARARPGDFVYVDSPYYPRSPTANFVSYSATGFTRRCQEDLASRVRSLISRGVQVLVSQSDVPEVRELYAGFPVTIESVSRMCGVGASAESRTSVDEVLIWGGYTP